MFMDFRVVFLLVGCPKCPLLRVVWLVVWSGRTFRKRRYPERRREVLSRA